MGQGTTSERDLKAKDARSLSLRLMRSTIYGLGWRYGTFSIAVISFALISLLPPEFFRFFTENVQNLSEIDAAAFLWRLGSFGLIVAVAMLVSTFGNAWCQEWLRLTMEARLRRQVMHRLHRLPLATLDTAQRGDWLTRMTSDLQETEYFLTDSIPNQVRNIAILLGAGILFFCYSGWLALVPIFSAIALAVLNLHVQKKMAPILQDLRVMHGNVFQALIESLEGIRTIRAHSAERFVHKSFESKISNITSRGMHVVRLFGALMGTTQFVSQLMVAGILCAVMWFLSGGQLSLHEALIYPFYIGLFYGAAQSLSASAYQWNRYFADAGRLAEMLYKEVAPPVVNSRETLNDFEKAQSIELRKLQIGYQGTPLTDPISFRLERGESKAITGPSGCGKSTFLEVVAGLRPSLGGEALIWGQEETSVWEGKHSPKLPLGVCAYVEQRPYIFEGSVRDNLTFGQVTTESEGTLWESLERVGLVDAITAKGGLDFILRDRGQNLSEGQRYRLALARAFLLKRPFILLDEPFAALDEASIEIVTQSLAQLKAQSGILVVTHYIPPTHLFDEICVLKTFGLERVPSSLKLERRSLQGDHGGNRPLSDTSAISRVASIQRKPKGGDHDKRNRASGHG